MQTVNFNTCFLTVEEFSHGATRQLSNVLKLLDKIPLECEDVRKVLHQTELSLLEIKQTELMNS